MGKDSHLDLMPRRFRDIAAGTGPGAWLIYMVPLALLFWALIPDRPLLIGALVGVMSGFRVELNGYRARLEALEAEPPAL